MSTQGIKITDLRPEIQTRINSDLVKYNPNKNGYIDDGAELSLLLSEYQCEAEDLTSKDSKEPMWTLDEQIEIREKGKEKLESVQNDYDNIGTPIAVLSAIGTVIGLGIIGEVSDNGHILIHKRVGIEKLVSDGSYTKGGRPAYDFDFGKMKNYITEADVANFDRYYSKGYSMASTAEELNHSLWAKYARDLNGKPFTLRNWKVGDPQYVKTETRLVEKYISTGKCMARFGLGGLGVVLAGILTTVIGPKIAQKKAEDEAKIDIKAAQTADGERIRQERIKHEEEMRQREAALEAEELEYRERMQDAVTGVDNQLRSAETRARNINKELREAEERKQTAPADSN